METFKIFLDAISISFLAMVTVINPLGTGFILNSMTEGISPQLKKTLAKKIVINTLGLFLVILVFGNYILDFFGLTLPIIRVGGGLLLSVMGWNMLNAASTAKTSSDISTSGEDFLSQSFYPFTFPVTSGPGCIAVLFTLTAHHTNSSNLESTLLNLAGTFTGLFAVAILIYFCYVYSSVIEKKLGQAGANALNRILAFITFCIGLTIIWAGSQELIKNVLK